MQLLSLGNYVFSASLLSVTIASGDSFRSISCKAPVVLHSPLAGKFVKPTQQKSSCRIPRERHFEEWWSVLLPHRQLQHRLSQGRTNYRPRVRCDPWRNSGQTGTFWNMISRRKIILVFLDVTSRQWPVLQGRVSKCPICSPIDALSYRKRTASSATLLPTF